MRARGRPPLAPIGAWPDPVDVDPGRLEFATEPAPHEDCVALFSVDGQLEYDAFNRDFGPLSLGCLLQFCRALDAKLASTQSSQQRVRFVTAAGSPARLANAVTLLAGWRVIRRGAHDAGSALSPFPSTLLARLPGYRDAGVASEDSSPLSVRDVVAGLARAVHAADPLLDSSALDVRAFHWLARPENGDLSWVAPDLIAFRGPIGDYVELDPDAQPAAFYVPYFQSHRVALVVRLNVEPRYDSRVFTSAGIDHLDLSFPDGAAPSTATIATFLAAYDRTRPGVVAAHCAAGLGRTGTMLAAGLMAKRGFSAREAVGWLRLCRPGSVLGSQVRFLEQELAPRLRIANTTAKLGHGEHPKSATVAATAAVATKSLVASEPLPTVCHYYVR